ncbi:MAG TPA: carboxypeptidase-like regulatory domain-containing protein [Terriglobia bacterium]|nr:carboxypeptidase-like regulatory domain-containing protein [Terriglobia bacterium]
MLRHCRKVQNKGSAGATIVLIAGLSAGLAAPARAAKTEINLTVVVTDAQTGQPISQAQLTLQFHGSGKIRHPLISYTAKTNAQGRCRFTDIPEGTLHLIVTHTGHQTFGRDFDVDASHTKLEVKLKPPHPQI